MQIFYIYYCEWRFKNTSRNTNLNYKLRRNRSKKQLKVNDLLEEKNQENHLNTADCPH